MREPIKDLIDEYANIADKNRYKNDKQVINDYKDGSIKWNFNNRTKEYDYGGHASGKKSTIPKKVAKEDKKAKTEDAETPEKVEKKKSESEDKEETAKPEKKDKAEKEDKEEKKEDKESKEEKPEKAEKKDDKDSEEEEKPVAEKKSKKEDKEEEKTEETAPKKETKEVKNSDKK